MIGLTRFENKNKKKIKTKQNKKKQNKKKNKTKQNKTKNNNNNKKKTTKDMILDDQVLTEIRSDITDERFVKLEGITFLKGLVGSSGDFESIFRMANKLTRPPRMCIESFDGAKLGYRTYNSHASEKAILRRNSFFYFYFYFYFLFLFFFIFLFFNFYFLFFIFYFLFLFFIFIFYFYFY